MKTLRAALPALALLAVAAAALFGLAFALSGGGSSSATNGCSTVLVETAEKHDISIFVEDTECFTKNDWVVINLGGDTQECKRLAAVDWGYMEFYGSLVHIHYPPEPVVRVDSCPTPEDCEDEIDNDLDGDVDCEDEDCYEDPICEPTPTPTPKAGCDTTLAEDANAGDDWIFVADPWGCDKDTSIVINPGEGTEECHKIESRDWDAGELRLYDALASDHVVGEPVVGAPECPEPTPGPTETPTPGAWECGTYGALEPWPDAVVSLNPDSGPAGTPFDVELTDVLPNDDDDQPVEVLWAWDAEEQGGELIGTGAVPQHETSTVVQAAVPEWAEPPADVVAVCWWLSVDETWYYQSASFQIGEGEPGETPTPEETPTPPPPNHIHDCPQAGKWALSMWEGGCGSDIGEALDTCGEGAVDAAYYLDAETQMWSRWFPGLPQVSNLVAREATQGLFLLGSATASPPASEAFTLPATGQMVGCPLPGKWSIAVWPGDDTDDPEGTDTALALDTCGEWEVDVAYALDPETGAWQHWFRDAPDISAADTEPDLIYASSGWGEAFKKLAKKGVLLHGSAKSPVERYVPRGAPLPDVKGGHIVFTSDRSGNQDIWRMHGDGSNPTQLTESAGQDTEPAWSADGLTIAFASNRDGDYDIYLMDNKGKNEAKILDRPGDQRRPTWDSSSHKLYYDDSDECKGETYPTVHYANLHWSSETKPPSWWVASDVMFCGHAYGCPFWKHDKWSNCESERSSNLDFFMDHHNNSMYVYECGTKMVRGAHLIYGICTYRFRPGEFEGIFEWETGLTCPDWEWPKKKKKKLVPFPLAPWIGIPKDWFQFDVSGIDTVPVVFDPDWRVDGRLAYAYRCGWDSQDKSRIGIGKAVGGDDPSLEHVGSVFTGGNDRQPTWSPDGSKIAFVSDETGTDQIYVGLEVQPYGRETSAYLRPERLTSEGENTDPDWYVGKTAKLTECSSEQ